MSTETFYTWVLPLGVGVAGGLYALWAARTYDRATARRQRENAGNTPAAAE